VTAQIHAGGFKAAIPGVPYNKRAAICTFVTSTGHGQQSGVVLLAKYFMVQWRISVSAMQLN
jgi:hypothetical protein